MISRSFLILGGTIKEEIGALKVEQFLGGKSTIELIHSVQSFSVAFKLGHHQRIID